MEKYAMIEISTGFLYNFIMWDGSISDWDTGSGYYLESLSETSSYMTSSNSPFSPPPPYIEPIVIEPTYTGSFTGSFTGSLLGTVSNSSTSSYVSNIKSGKVTSGEWVVELVGNNYTASVLLSSSYLNSSYAVSLTCGADIRTLSVTNKTPSGFNINSNSTSAMTDDIYWVTVPYNNS